MVFFEFLQLFSLGKLYVEGPNLLAATKLWLYRRVGSQDCLIKLHFLAFFQRKNYSNFINENKTLHTRKCFATISDVSLKWNIIIERVTYELRERETRCNARTLNTGITALKNSFRHFV